MKRKDRIEAMYNPVKPEDRSDAAIAEWLNFSTNKRTESEIEHALLYEPSKVCMSYICRFSVLSEEFIERLIVITSGLIDKDNVDTEYDEVKRLCEAKYSGDEEKAKKAKEMVTTRVTVKVPGTNSVRYEKAKVECTVDNINDRVDWAYIADYQKLSEPFMKKYVRVLPKVGLIHNQEMSNEFREWLDTSPEANPNKAKTTEEIYSEISKKLEKQEDKEVRHKFKNSDKDGEGNTQDKKPRQPRKKKEAVENVEDTTVEKIKKPKRKPKQTSENEATTGNKEEATFKKPKKSRGKKSKDTDTEE